MLGHIEVTSRHGETRRLVLDINDIFDIGEALLTMSDKEGNGRRLRQFGTFMSTLGEETNNEDTERD